MVAAVSRRPFNLVVRDIFAVAAQVRTRRAPMALQGPFATLPEPALRTLLGAGVTLARDPAMTRMQMRHGAITIIGLPALMLALGSRNLPSFILAVALLPAAMLAEVLRERLS